MCFLNNEARNTHSGGEVNPSPLIALLGCHMTTFFDRGFL